MMFFTLLAAPLLAAPKVVLRGGKVFTITHGVIENGVVVMENGKITYVGSSPSVGDLKGAKVYDVKGKHIFPGFVSAYSTLGMVGERGNDTNEASNPITADLEAHHAIDPFHPDVKLARQHGVTTVFVAPGNTNLIGGQGALIKTAGKTVAAMEVQANAALVGALGVRPKEVYGERHQAPSTRMGEAALLRATFTKALNYRAKLEAWEKEKKGEAPKRDLALEAVLRVLRGEVPFVVNAERADDVLTAVRLADEFGFRVIIAGGAESYRDAAILAEKKVAVIYGPMRVGSRDLEDYGRRTTTPAELERAGVEVALEANEDGVYRAGGLRTLMLDAALAVRDGMSEAKALEAITIVPARLFGVDGRLGSIEVGKDADVVVWPDHPFKIHSLPEQVFINGELVSSK